MWIHVIQFNTVPETAQKSCRGRKFFISDHFGRCVITLFLLSLTAHKKIYTKETMPSTKKVTVVADLQEKAGRAKSIAFAKYTGMSVPLQNELRAKVKEAGGEVSIARNRLVDVALERPTGLGEMMQDQLLTLFSYEDAVSALKALKDFIAEKGLPEIKGGYFESKVITAGEVEKLAMMPSKPELISMLLRQLQVPGQNLRGVLEAGPRNLVFALDAIAKKKAE